MTVWDVANVQKKDAFFDDDKVNEFTAKAKEADGFVFWNASILCTSKWTDHGISGPRILQQWSIFCV